MKLTRISIFTEINKTHKKEKAQQAQSGPTQPCSASKPAQHGLPRRGLTILQKVPCALEKITYSSHALFI